MILGNSDLLERVLDAGDRAAGGKRKPPPPPPSDSDEDEEEEDTDDEEVKKADADASKWGSLPPGLSAAEARSRLQLMFSRGVARAAASVKVSRCSLTRYQNHVESDWNQALETII